MTLDNMTGITKGSHTAGDTFCKSQLITCNRVKECNGVCPFEDALKHADKTQTMNDQHTVDHDRDWIIGCIEHDGFIHTHRFDKANQIIHDALSAEAVQGWIPVSERLPERDEIVLVSYKTTDMVHMCKYLDDGSENPWWSYNDDCLAWNNVILAWMPLPPVYQGE